MNHPLAITNRRSFLGRKDGVFKKTFELQKRFGANAAVVIELDGEWFVYRSTDFLHWPPPMEEIQTRNEPHNVLPWDFQTTRDAAEIGNLMTGPEADTPGVPKQSTTTDGAESYLLGVHLKDNESNSPNQSNIQPEDMTLPSMTAADTDSLERTDSDLSLLEPIAGRHQPCLYPRTRSATHSRTSLTDGIRSSSPGRVQKPRHRLHAPPAAPPSAVLKKSKRR